jgi:hypothetical protein
MVIVAVGVCSVDDLTREVKRDSMKIFTIGDAKEPRKIADAIREGFDTAVSI